MNTQNPKKKMHFRGSLFWPVVLIVFGVVFLLNNLGSLSTNAWDTILLCWPLLLVIAGLDNLLRRDGAAVPTFFIGLGVVLLLSNFGQLAWSAWVVLWSIWPVFLVAVGLDIMFGRRSIWLGLLAGVLVVAILVGIFWYFGLNPAGAKLAADSIEQPLSEVRQAEVSIQPIVGFLSLTALNDSKNLIEGKVMRMKGENIQSDFREQGGEGFFDLSSSGGTVIFPNNPGSEPSWDIQLTPQIPLNLKIQMIIGKSSVDTRNLMLSSLSTSLVIGETDVYLPAKGQFNAKIEGVIGRIMIYVPASMEIQINSDVGLLNVQVPKDYVSGDGMYFSPGFKGAENRVTVDVSQVIGQVQVVSK